MNHETNRFAKTYCCSLVVILAERVTLARLDTMTMNKISTLIILVLQDTLYSYLICANMYTHGLSIHCICFVSCNCLSNIYATHIEYLCEIMNRSIYTIFKRSTALLGGSCLPEAGLRCFVNIYIYMCEVNCVVGLIFAMEASGGDGKSWNTDYRQLGYASLGKWRRREILEYSRSARSNH